VAATALVDLTANVLDAHIANPVNASAQTLDAEMLAHVAAIALVEITVNVLDAHIANIISALAQTFDAEELAHVAATVLVEITVSVLIAHTANLIKASAQTFDAVMLAHVVATVPVEITANALDVLIASALVERNGDSRATAAVKNRRYFTPPYLSNIFKQCIYNSTNNLNCYCIKDLLNA